VAGKLIIDMDATTIRETRVRTGFLERYCLDAPLLIAILIAALLGLVVLYSAGHENATLIMRQSLRLSLGFLIMVAVAQISPHYLRLWTPWIFLVGLALLLAVLMVGEIAKGAQRWLYLGVMRFQPSELMKIAVPMMMAWYLANKPLPLRFHHVLLGFFITIVPVLFIAKQPDLGTALLVGFSGIFVLFLGGMSWKLIFSLGGATAAATPVFWHFGMRDYQRQRILTFLNPETDPLGTGYHIIQSKIAIGSGGLYGKGWLNGTQSHLEFLPESSTDFIFAVCAEEFGLLGLCVLLLLYFFIIARGLYIATQATTTYNRLLAGSLALIFFIYVFVNAGMVCGLLPVVGVPLPLISYGGTSLVTLMAGFGILMSVYTYSKALSR